MKKLCKLCFGIFAILLLIICSGCADTEYSVKDFTNVTVVGYSEHGTLAIKVNDEAINQIYAGGKKDKTAALRFAETFKFAYDGQNDEDPYFSNGDVVTINVTYDESMAKSLGVSFSDSSFDYTVEGLEDKMETSPFEGLSVKFSGVAPYGSVQLDKSNCLQYVIDNVTFYCDNYDLSNGDKIVVRAEYNAEIAEKNGYVFTEDVKKYTVVGLPKYVKTMYDVTYSNVTAKMRYMAESYLSEDNTSYKSLKWYFGDEDTDTDSDTDTEEQAVYPYDEYSEDQNDANEEDLEENSEEDENNVFASFGSFEDDSDKTSSKKKKKLSDIQKLKKDFVLSNFRASFEYTPVECYYSLNQLQYSDNIFTAVYKVKGTFVCEESNGSGYLKPGDTVVGELYLIASLNGGSVDIKNNLFYEDSVLTNFHSYSVHSVEQYENVTSEVFGSTDYLVEHLDYYEDADAYDDFVKKLETKTKKREDAHITIDTSTDTESKKKRENSSEEETDTDTENVDENNDENGYIDEYGNWYNQMGDDSYDYDNGNYDDAYGYDEQYDEQGYLY